jgi:TATA-binding protein-associated factor Taf7
MIQKVSPLFLRLIFAPINTKNDQYPLPKPKIKMTLKKITSGSFKGNAKQRLKIGYFFPF